MTRTTASFGSELAAAMRREIYGEDLGQTGWRSVSEQAEIAALLGARTRRAACWTSAAAPAARPWLWPSAPAARHRARCRSSRHCACPVGGGGAIALAAAPSSWRSIAAARFPSPTATFDAVLCVDAINHLPDRHGHAWRNGRGLLRPGGRLLFTDALVVTGPLSKPEIDVRSGLGFYLFVPPGVNEAAIAGAGLSLLQMDGSLRRHGRNRQPLARRARPASARAGGCRGRRLVPSSGSASSRRPPSSRGRAACRASSIWPSGRP